MSSSFGGKRGGVASSSDLLRSLRISTQFAAASSYVGKHKLPQTSDSVLTASSVSSIVSDLASYVPVTRNQPPPPLQPLNYVSTAVACPLIQFGSVFLCGIVLGSDGNLYVNLRGIHALIKIPPPYTTPIRLTISNNYGSSLDTTDSWPTSILSGQDGALYIAEWIQSSNTTCIDRVILPTVLSPTAVSVSKFAYIPGPSPFAGLSPILWLDASDPTTLVGSESSVTQWSDKSGQNNHGVLAIPTSQGAILIKNALNGLPGLSFPLLTGNGGNPFLCGNLLTGTTYSMFIVVKFAQNVTLDQVAVGEWKSYYGSGFNCDTNWGLISTHVSGTTYTKTPGNAVPVDKSLPHVFSGSLSSSTTSPNATFIMGIEEMNKHIRQLSAQT